MEIMISEDPDKKPTLGTFLMNCAVVASAMDKKIDSPCHHAQYEDLPSQISPPPLDCETDASKHGRIKLNDSSSHDMKHEDVESPALPPPLEHDVIEANPERRKIHFSSFVDVKHEDLEPQISQPQLDQEEATSQGRREMKGVFSHDAKRKDFNEPTISRLGKSSKLLIFDLEEKVNRTRRLYRIKVILRRVVIAVLTLVWLLLVPLVLSYNQGITKASAWYFSIQSGFGVGFGAISVEGMGIEFLLAIHLLLGSIYIALLLTTLIEFFAERTAEKKLKKEMEMSEEEEEKTVGRLLLGQVHLHMSSFYVAVALYILVLIAGTLYGTLRERWTFGRSLLFAISGPHSTGLVAPTIKPFDENAIFNPIFVSFLVTIGVPVHAFVIGKLTMILLDNDSNKKNLSSAMSRRRKARAALLRVEENITGQGKIKAKFNDDDDGVHDENSQDKMEGQTKSEKDIKNNIGDEDSGIDRFAFLSLYLLEQNKIREHDLLQLMKEYEFLKSNGNSRDVPFLQHEVKISTRDNFDSVPLWKINARLQFMQLVHYKGIKKNKWPYYIRDVEERRSRKQRQYRPWL
mmetsp:Transcript_14666/g.20736  ORF Transcript_14666/g.20736 Transcript_14666/m.20736 type:complete len:574 (+) Transcript_14666:73-1794(+)